MRALRIDGRAVLPRPRVISAIEARERAPALLAARLQGGALWSDAFMAEPGRVIMETLRWAAACGARLLNHAELIGAVPLAAERNRGFSRLRVLDRLSGRELLVNARTVINVAGAAIDEVSGRLGVSAPPMLRPTLAWNVLLDIPAPSSCSLAIAAPSPGARTYFLHSLHGRLLAGTGHAAADTTRPMAPSAAQLRQMLDDFDAALPGAGVGSAAVARVLWGVLPGVRAGSGQLAPRPSIVDATAIGGARVCTVLGVKFTEAPDVARAVLDRVTGTGRADLPRRPVPATGWDMMSGQPVERDAVLSLAASESAVYLEDLIERRTNAWYDEAACRRLEAIVNGALRTRAA
jgi:glycerol-3-phosphate dehydrogenase